MTTVLQLESSCYRDIVRLCTAVITERRTSVSSLNTPHPHQPSCRHACVHHPTMCIFLICYSQTTEECKSLWDWYSLLPTPSSNHWGKSKCTPHTSEFNGEWIKICYMYHSPVLAEYTPMYIGLSNIHCIRYLTVVDPFHSTSSAVQTYHHLTSGSVDTRLIT